MMMLARFSQRFFAFFFKIFTLFRYCIYLMILFMMDSLLDIKAFFLIRSRFRILVLKLMVNKGLSPTSFVWMRSLRFLSNVAVNI